MPRSTILHLITGLLVGGTEMMLQKLLSRIDTRRYRNLVVCLREKGPMGAAIEQLDVPVYCLGMPRGWLTLRGLGGLLGILRRERPHVLQTWMYHADLVGLVGGRVAGLPHVVWNLRCANLECCSRMSTWTIKACARLSRGPSVVVVNSEAGRAFHAALGYRPGRWAVIPNGFDLDRFAPSPAAREAVRTELGLRPGAVLIGLVARHDPTKGHDTFLRAAADLVADHPEAHFLLVGRDVVPSNPALASLLDGHPARQSLHLLGEQSDIPRLLAAMDIATSSSYGEGFSNVIGEAMSCAVPCVVTDVGDSAIIVGDTGIVVPPRDPEALARGWRRLLNLGPEGRRDLGGTARRRIQQSYSLDSVVRRYEDLYSALVEGRQAAAGRGVLA